MNRNRKNEWKKQKKVSKRNERRVNDVADVLENFSLDKGDSYDFKVDFN